MERTGRPGNQGGEMHIRGFVLIVISIVLLAPSTLSAEPATVKIFPYNRLKKITSFTYPKEEMTVTSEVNGRCISITTDIGTVIPDGGVIAEIDRTFIELEIEANEIGRERVRRQLAEEEKSLRRYSKLLSENSTPQARLDEVALAADLHRLELENLVNEGRRLKEQLARHTVTAPSGWKVIERYTTAGEYLQVGSAVAKLGDFRHLLISFGFSSEELAVVQQLEDLRVSIPEVNANLPATIYRISPVFDPHTRKIMVDLLVENSRPGSDKVLRGGMRVELSFPEKTKGIFEIPTSAVISKYEANWIVRPNGERVQIVSLGASGKKGTTLVTGDVLESGQRYLLHPEQAAAGDTE